ncbi:MAG: thioredoxin domain-containing protein, partial [Bacteroidia bacterium]
MSTEPGVLSLSEEITTEPITAALMIKKGDDLKADYVKATVAFPHYYFFSAIYNKDNIIEDKKDLFDSFDANFMILCTSSYCSSPMSDPKEFLDFMYKRVLDTK